MATLSCWSYRATVLVLPLILVSLAAPRLQSGIALEGAFPVPDYMTRNVTLPRDAYRAAVAALSHASERDSASAILRGEAALFIGTNPKEVEASLRQNLTRNPASARGWTLLAESLSFHDRNSASLALSQALATGTLEYALIGRQTRLAARLWDELPVNTHRTVLGQVELLWTNPSVRLELSTLLATQGGEALIAQTFANTRQTHQAVIDWVQAYRQRLFGQN
jgi:hypothetical protein